VPPRSPVNNNTYSKFRNAVGVAALVYSKYINSIQVLQLTSVIRGPG